MQPLNSARKMFLYLSFFVSALGLVTAAPLREANFTYAHVPGTVPFNLKEPLQQRLAYVNSSAMHVSWNTYASLNASEASVIYGTDPFNLDLTAYATSMTYNTSRTWNHHALLTGLQPKQDYWYRVAYTNCYGCSNIPTYKFTTLREKGDTSAFSLAVVVDMGTMGADGLSDSLGPLLGGSHHIPLKKEDSNTIQSLAQSIDTYDAILHPGDIAYADYFTKESINGYFGNGSIIVNMTSVANGYETILEEYYDQITPLTATRPYMVGPGNHEANCDNGGTSDSLNNINYTVSICTPGQTNFTGYINHWRMPGNVDEVNRNFWYSYDAGMVHIVFLDTETDLGGNLTGPDEIGGSELEFSGPFGAANEQVNWLKSDLAAVDRSVTPWVVVFAHRPWYVSATNRSSTVCLDCQKAFEPTLIEYNVDLVMHGHVHAYQRNMPMKNYAIDPNGLNNPAAPLDIVNGAAGHYDGLDALLNATYYSAVQNDVTFGWSRLTFHNRTHLTHQFIASANSSVLDEVTLYKEHSF
ncbi:Metallo-dependent phosphatase-like protein [Naematelia encephala]|uniref:Purple acid phosphatase n=1 Tax=Naematelia encephala TaxID=71784 RepID=A0A1Y2B2J4_9TREE|nr:Metallo-dependent phosphatase-like protein [Naematelia encephala]